MSEVHTFSSDVAFTPAVKAVQTRKGSRDAYAHIEQNGGWRTEIDENLAGFLGETNSFYFATASADGQPYIQHRGGPKGFVKILDKNTIAWLQALIRVNIDSHKGFEHAAEEVSDPDLTGLFRDCAIQRAAFAEELERLVAGSATEPLDEGTLLGRLHRAWLDLKARLKEGDPHAILVEVERGEDALDSLYESAIFRTTGSPVNDVLHSHLRAVRASHERIRELREATKGR